MSAIEKFDAFMADLASNKQVIVAQLADAEDKVSLLRRDLQAAEALLPAAQKTALAAHQETRVGIVKAALDQAEADFAALEQQHKDLDPAMWAAAAIEEFDALINDAWQEFGASIRAAEKARQTYLQAIVKVGQAMSKGNNLVDAGVRTQAHSPKKLATSARFMTHLHPYVVDLDAIKAAIYRGRV